MGNVFGTSSATNTKASNPKGTYDNFKHNAEVWILRILIVVAAVIVAFIVAKLALRFYYSSQRAKLQAEIGELQAELQIAKEFGR